MKYLFTILFIICFSTTMFSQVDATDSSSAVIVEEFVTIYKDPRLDILDKRSFALQKFDLDQKKVEEQKKAAEIPLYKPIVSADGKKKVVGSIYTVKGFRIVIYNGSDKNAALAIKNNFSRSFSGTRSYLSYNVPSYKIKVGDFDDRKEATNFLKRLSGAFPAAFIVPDIVTVKSISITQ